MDMPERVTEFATVGEAGVVGWLWKHLTGRITKLECKILERNVFDKHVVEQNTKFETLFTRQEKIGDKIADVHSAVARIEGVLSRRRDDVHGN